MALVLEPLCEYHADLAPPTDVGPGPFGMRRIYDVTGGRVAGPRLAGRILPSGGDWLLVGPDRVAPLPPLARGGARAREFAAVVFAENAPALLVLDVAAVARRAQPKEPRP